MQIERGIIRNFDPTTWRADVELMGAHTALLAGVPVAGNLGPGLLATGTRVWVCLSAEGNPLDGAVLVPYGGAPVPWVSSRLWKPSLVTAERTTLASCTSASFVNVPGLSLGLSLEVTSSVLLLLAATGFLSNGDITYSLAFYHDDAHETTQLTPIEAIGGAGAAASEYYALAYMGLQTDVAPGAHTFVLKHRVSSGQGNLQRGRVVALAMGQ